MKSISCSSQIKINTFKNKNILKMKIALLSLIMCVLTVVNSTWQPNQNHNDILINFTGFRINENSRNLTDLEELVRLMNESVAKKLKSKKYNKNFNLRTSKNIIFPRNMCVLKSI